MRLAVLAFFVLALAAPVAATGDLASGDKVAGTVLAIESSRGQDYLVRVDRESLRPVSKRVAVGGHAYAWSFSPDGRRLALGVDRVKGVRIFDVRRVKPLGQLRTWSGGISTIAWLGPRRLLGWEPAGLFMLDPIARRRLASPQASGDVVSALRAGSRLALLMAPIQEIGPAQLAVVGVDGAVRTVPLGRIRAGMRPEGDGMGQSYRPALVYDMDGRVFVLGAGGDPMAEVDVARLAVTYHEPKHSQTLLTRFRNWIEPAAAAKLPLTGSFRDALWLGEGKIAFWGYESISVGTDRVEMKQIGLSVVDTNDWTIKTIDGSAWGARFGGSTLLAWYQHGGLNGYSLDGAQRYHLFGGDALGVVATYGSRAFVAFDHKPLHVIDAATGEVLGTRRGLPRLLDSGFSGW
ncbi:MAG TPA: hypothetical protein VKB13_00810 [Gaiellaceae bacterium]|nr:hypothetical protein [Gaiellaceae bacterium]